MAGCWHGYLSRARCRLDICNCPADATATHISRSSKSRLVLPFWYWLTWVVPDKVEGGGRKKVVVVVVGMYAHMTGENYCSRLHVSGFGHTDGTLL